VVDSPSQILQQEVCWDALIELKMYRWAPGISHFLFVDDAMLFVKAVGSQPMVIKEALSLYERGTSQLINPDKCSMMFGTTCIL
jgi:hypothetical protein